MDAGSTFSARKTGKSPAPPPNRRSLLPLTALLAPLCVNGLVVPACRGCAGRRWNWASGTGRGCGLGGRGGGRKGLPRNKCGVGNYTTCSSGSDGVVPLSLQANALEQFLRPTMLRLVGPALGGLVIGLQGTGAAFALDALTFLVSAGCLVAMRPVTRPSLVNGKPTEEGSLLQEALAGYTFVRSRVWLWGTFAAATLAYLLFIGPTEVLLPYLVKHSLHGDAGELGLVLSAGGIGAVVAAVIVSRTGLPRRQFTFMYLTWALATLAVAGYGLATSGWQLMLACFVINGLEAAGTIAWATTKQRLIPTELMGRVSSLDWFISIAGLPLSYALTAPVAALLGVRTTLIGAGVLGAAVTAAAVLLPGMLDVDGGHEELPALNVRRDVAA